MKITAGESTLMFDEKINTIYLAGSMRLANMREYEVVKKFIRQAYDKTENVLIIDFRKLIFLNSSGITTISMFILAVKKLNKAKINILGSKKVSWQEKSLKNFNKLWNEVKIEIE